MKNKLLQTLRLCVMVLLLSATSTTARASHAAAMELTYSALGNNTYAFTLHFYRDGCGINPSGTMTINLTSSCGTRSLTLVAGAPVNVNALCQSYQSQTCCNGGTLSCFSEWTYTGTTTLPPCNDWVASYSECCRNASIVNLSNPGSANLYAETTINNVDFPNNHSVQFNHVPAVYACSNAPFSYSPMASDADGDSLVFSLSEPLTATNTAVGWAVGYSTATPFGSSTISINSETGVINAPPPPAGNYVISMTIREYRNGALVATTIRDIQVLVLSNCGQQAPPPVFPVVSDTAVSGNLIDTSALDNHFSVCAGSTLSFHFTGTGSSNMTYSTNLSNTLMPGAVLTVVGTLTTSIGGQFVWNTTGMSAGVYSFYVALEDNACPAHNIVWQQFSIEIKSINANTNRSYICVGNTNTVQLGASSSDGTALTGTFTWSPSAGLDNPNIANPVATISQPTTYSVIYNDGFCQLTDETSILASPYTIAIEDLNDEILCASNSVVLDATVASQATSLTGVNPNTTLIPRATSGVPTVTNIPFYIGGLYPSTISTLSDLNIINSINFNISQQLMDHLIISLVAPSGQTLILSQNNGGAGNGYVNSTFAYPVSGTALPITNYNNAALPSNLSFIPQGGATAWQNLIGATVNGTWHLRIEHNGTGTTYDGTFLNATLQFNTLNTITYAWTPSNGLSDANIASPTASPTATTTYTVSATNAMGCMTSAQATVYVQNTLPTPVLAVQPSVQYPITFNWPHVAGAASYELSLDGGNTFFNNGTSHTYTPNGLSVGDTVTLCVRGLPAAGSSCIASPLSCQTQVLGPCTNLNTTINGDLLICPNTTTSLTALSAAGAAPYNYVWSTGDTTNQVTGLSPGTYTISVTDGNACSSIDTIDIVANPAVDVNIAGNNVRCYQGHTGIATATVLGGSAPYTYHWSSGSTNSILGNLSVGTYAVTVTDANQCTATDQVTLTQPDPLLIEAAVTDVTCSQSYSGAINITTEQGGTPPYAYYWSINTTTHNLYNLAVGTYNLTVTDANLCTFNLTKYVAQGTQLAITGSITNNESPFNIGAISISVTNGTPPYTYNWSNGMQGQTITGLSSGLYTVSISDANNCTATFSLFVSDINGTSPAISATPNLDVLPNPNNGVFDIKLEHTDNESVQLDILNINGQLIYHTELNTPHIQLPIDLSQQPSGHYIVKATLGQQVYLKRFIIH